MHTSHEPDHLTKELLDVCLCDLNADGRPKRRIKLVSEPVSWLFTSAFHCCQQRALESECGLKIEFVCLLGSSTVEKGIFSMYRGDKEKISVLGFQWNFMFSAFAQDNCERKSS